MGGPTAPYEQGIAEPVQIPDRFGRNLFFAAERDDYPLSPPADRTGRMQFRIDPSAARQHKAAQRRQRSIHGVDLSLELLDLSVCNSRLFGMHILGPCRENRAQVEQLVLNAAEDYGQVREQGLARGRDACKTQERVQLVDRSVRLNAEIVFRNSLSAHKPGFAAIPALGVDAVERHPRLVEGLIVHKSDVNSC